MRRKLVVGNWKMNFTASAASKIAEEMVPKMAEFTSVDISLCPTFLSIPGLEIALKGTNIAVGAQDVFWLESGAFTGSISATMLKEHGVQYVIVGHSETRGRFGKLDTPEDTVLYFAETDRTVSLKISAVLAHALIPILCVGETLSEREAGLTDEVIRKQIHGALDGTSPDHLAIVVIAYEPVWAIGTGKTCDASEADRVCGVIRATIEGLSSDAGLAVRVLYGGSVKAANAPELFGKANIDGGLVGGASMIPDEFAAIVKAAN